MSQKSRATNCFNYCKVYIGQKWFWVKIQNTNQFFFHFPLFFVKEVREGCHTFHLVGSRPSRTWCFLFNSLFIEPTDIHMVCTRSHTTILKHTNIQSLKALKHLELLSHNKKLDFNRWWIDIITLKWDYYKTPTSFGRNWL